MPKDPRIKKVLVIGSGPIIIGQAAEFDYSGTQACRALKSEGVETVLVNSNPATIMTDPDIADHVYIEPLTAEVIERIIEKEKPTHPAQPGRQMGLNLSMELARSGFLDRSGVRLLACKPDTIDRAEDRQLFKDTMEKLHQPIIPSKVVEDLDDALDFARSSAIPSSCAPPSRWAAPAAASAKTARSCTRSPRTVCACLPSTRSSLRSASPAGRRSSMRSCVTPRATSSRSATWRTLTPLASTPATPSLWRPARPSPTRSTRCCAPPRWTSSPSLALRAAATASLR